MAAVHQACSTALKETIEKEGWHHVDVSARTMCRSPPVLCSPCLFLGGLHKLPVAFWSDCVEALFGHAATRRHLIPGYHSGSFETCFVQFSQDAPPADEVVKVILSNIDVGGICKILKDWSTSLSLSASFNNMCIICGHQ